MSELVYYSYTFYEKYKFCVFINSSDDSDSNLLLDQSAEIKSKTDYDFICSHFVPSCK